MDQKRPNLEEKWKIFMKPFGITNIEAPSTKAKRIQKKASKKN